MLRRVCVRDINLVVAVLCQYRKFIRYRELHRYVGQWELRTVIFTHFFLTRNQAKILILKDLDQRRSMPWDWGIILIVIVIRCLICMLDGIIITPSCDEDVQHWTNIRRPTSCRLWLCPDIDAEDSWIECIGDAITAQWPQGNISGGV